MVKNRNSRRSNLAIIGLNALIDEATGHQNTRFKEKPRGLEEMYAGIEKDDTPEKRLVAAIREGLGQHARLTLAREMHKDGDPLEYIQKVFPEYQPPKDEGFILLGFPDDPTPEG